MDCKTLSDRIVSIRDQAIREKADLDHVVNETASAMQMIDIGILTLDLVLQDLEAGFEPYMMKRTVKLAEDLFFISGDTLVNVHGLQNEIIGTVYPELSSLSHDLGECYPPA